METKQPEEVKISPWDAYWNDAMKARGTEKERSYGWGMSGDMYDFSENDSNLFAKWVALAQYNRAIILSRP